MKTTSLFAALLLGVAACSLTAQDTPKRPQGQPPGGQGGPGGPGGAGGQRPPPMPIIGALDQNHNGVIDADEIAKASESLKKLDKNGDGKLTPDEFRGPRPGGQGGQGGPGGPGGQGNREGRPPRPPQDQ